MATYFDKFNDLLSQADNASALARTKVIARLMWLQKTGWDDITNKLWGALCASIPLGALVFGATQWAGVSEWGSVLCIMGVWGLNTTLAATAHWKCKKYERHAKNAGVFINFKANRTPSASFKVRVVDAYEAWGFPSPQLSQLKAIAQRNDIPQGWWESACNLINDYREHCLRAERVQKYQDSEKRAEQRLAELSYVEIVPQTEVLPFLPPVQEDPTRLLL